MDETRIQDRGEAGTVDPMALDEAPPTPRARLKGGVGQPIRHDSGAKHVTGEARYTDDEPELPGTLQVFIAMSPRANARVLAMDLDPVRAAKGVACVLGAADVPGINDYSPVFGDDPIFAEGHVHYVGQPLFAVAATDLRTARMAARLAKVEYEDAPPAITIDEALTAADEAGEDLLPAHEMRLGDADAALAAAPHVVSGRVETGGQDHFYLEGQIASAIPLEDGDVLVRSSTQHPSEVQHNVAKALGRPDNAVTIEVRRMGGGFGGKESQPALFAAVCALVAVKTGRPAKCRLDRDDDMEMTGKRHEMRADYRVGHDGEGRILGASFRHAVRCGYSKDLSGAIADRAMFHADNAYDLKAAHIHSRRLKTNTVSNTAFRGFGGPQGMVAIERAMDRIAFDCKLDPLDVRKRNFYARWARGHRAARPITWRSRTASSPRSSRSWSLQRLPRAARGGAGLQRVEPGPQEGPRADAGEVRHLLHDDPSQPGRRAGPCLQGRLGPSQPRRHGDGAGPLHQGRAGRGRGVPDRRRGREDHRDHHGEGAQHLGHGGLVRLRPQRHGRPGRRPHDQGAADRLCRVALRRGARGGGVRAGTVRIGRRSCASATSWARPISRASRCPRPAFMPRPASPTTAKRRAASRSTTSPTALPAPRW